MAIVKIALSKHVFRQHPPIPLGVAVARSCGVLGSPGIPVFASKIATCEGFALDASPARAYPTPLSVTASLVRFTSQSALETDGASAGVGLAAPCCDFVCLELFVACLCVRPRTP